MLEGYLYYGIVALTVHIMGVFGILPNFVYRRVIIVTSFLVFLIAAFFSTVDLMSRPRPVELMLASQRPNPEKAKLLAAHMVEDKYIMLLLDWDGIDYPRYFRFPWNKDMAEQIQGAIQQAQTEHAAGVELAYPFDDTLERRDTPLAYPMPTPQMIAPKQEATPEIFQFAHPSQGT